MSKKIKIAKAVAEQMLGGEKGSVKNRLLDYGKVEEVSKALAGGEWIFAVGKHRRDALEEQ